VNLKASGICPVSGLEGQRSGLIRQKRLLALRQQLAILKRSKKRPQIRNRDRLLPDFFEACDQPAMKYLGGREISQSPKLLLFPS
jgi:hypothetical protein